MSLNSDGPIQMTSAEKWEFFRNSRKLFFIGIGLLVLFIANVIHDDFAKTLIRLFGIVAAGLGFVFMLLSLMAHPIDEPE